MSSVSGPIPAFPHAGLAAPSPWLLRWSSLIRPGGRVLDVACGSGRHVRWLAQQGFDVTALDRDSAALEPLRAIARVCIADIESGDWPLPGQQFDALLVTNYLWRALWPSLMASLAPGAVLIYETFADGNQSVGKPSRPDFLLDHGELLTLTVGLRVVAYEDGFLDGPARFVQRIVAVSEATGQAVPPRYPL